MAKLALINKQKKQPKFRESGLPKVPALPYLFP